MPSFSTADPSDHHSCGKDSASKSEVGRTASYRRFWRTRNRIWLWRAEPRDLVLFSITARLALPLGPPLRSFSKWRGYSQRIARLSVRPSYVFFLRVRRPRSFLRSLIL